MLLHTANCRLVGNHDNPQQRGPIPAPGPCILNKPGRPPATTGLGGIKTISAHIFSTATLTSTILS